MDTMNNFEEWVSLLLLAGMLVIVIMQHFEKKSMQATIDRLTDKLMAKDYREYVAMQPREKQPEQPTRKPLSWYDDPNIEDERDAH